MKKGLMPVLFLILLLFSCSGNKEMIKNKSSQKPNILWINLEDTAPLLSCYDTSLISTPNIDDLAENGVLYTNVFMPAPVCSASRSSIITGVMSTTLGAQNHHSSPGPWNLPFICPIS